MLEMHRPAFRDQFEERLVIERVQLSEFHSAGLTAKSDNRGRFLDFVRNDKRGDVQSNIEYSVHPLVAL